MKRYIYIDAITMQERPIEAGEVQVTTNGELVFLSSNRDNGYVVAGVAPGFWSRFWEEGDIPDRSHLPIPDDDQS